MKLDGKKRSILYWCLAILLFASLLFATCKEGRQEKLTYQIVYFGDSVPGLVRDESGIPSIVSDAVGKTVLNTAFGGTCISRIDVGNELDFGKESLSLVALTKSVANEDFGPQQTIRMREAVAEEFESMVDVLEQVDFSNVELVIIQHGVNDYYGGVPIRNTFNEMDEYSFAGAMRTSIKALRQANPNMRILFVTPTYSWLIDENKSCEEYENGYGVLEDYIAEELRIAEECDVEIIDIYHDFYPHDEWEDWSLFTIDGIHPNEAGREKIAKKISEYLKGENR